MQSCVLTNTMISHKASARNATPLAAEPAIKSYGIIKDYMHLMKQGHDSRLGRKEENRFDRDW